MRTRPSDEARRPVVILGAGLTGLSAAYHLTAKRSLLVERAAEVGGHARSERRDGYTFDVTGHWLHLRDDRVQRLAARLFRNGELVEITDAVGATSRFERDPAGNVTAFVDALSRRTTYSYDQRNVLTGVTDPLGGEFHYTIDGAGNVTAYTDALNRTYTRTYDDLNQLASVTDPLGRVATTVYDAAGRPVAAVNPLRYVALRYFNVVGSGSPELFDTSPHNLFPIVFDLLYKGETPGINGDDYPTPDGTCVRDYIHVADLADAHVGDRRDGGRARGCRRRNHGQRGAVRDRAGCVETPLVIGKAAGASLMTDGCARPAVGNANMATLPIRSTGGSRSPQHPGPDLLRLAVRGTELPGRRLGLLARWSLLIREWRS